MAKIESHHIAQRDIFKLRAGANTIFRQILLLSFIWFSVMGIYMFHTWGAGPWHLIWSYFFSHFWETIKQGKHLITLSLNDQTAEELRSVFSDAQAMDYHIEASTLANASWLQIYVGYYLGKLRSMAGYSAMMIYGLGFVFLLMRQKKLADEANKPKHIRGNKVITPKELVAAIQAWLKAKGEASNLYIRHADSDAKIDIPIPVSCENSHFLLAGRSRTGKSVFMKWLFVQMRKMGAKGIIHDPQGEYVESFFNPESDIIFNPLDDRGLKWNVMGEIKTRMDIDSMAESLIPVPKNVNQPHFHQAAQDIMRGVLNFCYINNLHANSEIWNIMRSDIDTLIGYFEKTPGAEAALKALGSQDMKAREAPAVLSTFMQHVKIFEYMANWDGDQFNSRAWLASDRPGFIFCLGNDEVQTTLRPILSLFINTLGRNFLSLGTDLTRRIYFLLDEFPELQKLPAIDSLLRMGGKKGASVMLAAQGIGKIYDTYGRDLAGELLNNLGSSAVFAIEDPTASKYFSEKFGKHEIERQDVMSSQGTGVLGEKDHQQIRTIRETIDLCLPAEIEGLPPLNCFLKLSGFDLTRIQVPVTPYLVINFHFSARQALHMSVIQAEHEAREAEERERKKERLREPKKDKDKDIDIGPEINEEEEDDIRDI